MASTVYLLRPRSPSRAAVESALKIAGAAGLWAEVGAGCLIVAAGPGRSATLWLDGRSEGDPVAYGFGAELLTAGGVAAALKKYCGKVRVKFSRVGHSLDLSVEGCGVRAEVDGPWALRAEARDDGDLYRLASGLEKEGFSVRELRLAVRRTAP